MEDRGTPSYWNQSEPTSHKCRRSSTKVQRDGRTPLGKRSPYGSHAGLELPRVSPYRQIGVFLFREFHNFLKDSQI
jgi:hypothetical protein